jgi:hypothetical protein
MYLYTFDMFYILLPKNLQDYENLKIKWKKVKWKNQIKDDEIGRDVAWMRDRWEMDTKNSIGKAEDKRPLGRWQNNIKIDLKEIREGSLDWIHLDQEKD